ncbi:WG repeat-containing protein [Rugosimonospora acidiphila]|uniref:WG repeat-containing protein n=1 Tax=Rugosimonospora acidiphila TaxID=556531 RepID=A0ABP9RQ07_9ACTN
MSPRPSIRRPRLPRPGEVFTGGDGIPAGLRPDIVEALTAPTPPGGVRYEAPAPEPEPVEPVSSPPVSAPPVSAAPVSGSPVSASPVSAPPVSAPPVSAPPVSAPPVSAPPVSAPPVSAPPVSAPPVSAPPGPSAEGEAGPAVSGPDPEQTLSTWEWVFDPNTLREVADDKQRLEQIRELLTVKLNGQEDNAPRARLLSLRAVVSRILGDLQKAQADGKLALAHAEATGELRRIAIAQARLAHVLQWRSEFEEADRLFALANSTELPDRLRATMYQHSGKCAYDQGRYIEACNHFEMALELRKTEDPEMIAHTELALDAVFRKVAENGWGPYPRTREEILQIRRPPTPALDEQTGLWGFTDAEGETKVAALYSDVQPFRDGVAWVQRPDEEAWELIDEAGETLIPSDAGYLGVSSFSDSLAWVSQDGTARWIAIDKANAVTISTGFEDVRPFRRGMAAVRRGGRWGAVDGIGRAVVPFKYDSFATALSDGRYIDGFSDEGLAVVELGGRKGVVDRAGRVLVEPVHPALVIHPVAFLITDGAHRWGALDRRGRMVISPSHPSRMAVTEEIDRLLVDARPML